MKLLLSIVCFALVLATLHSVDAHRHREQVWGDEQPNTRLAYEYIEYQPKGIRSVDINFPPYVSQN